MTDPEIVRLCERMWNHLRKIAGIDFSKDCRDRDQIIKINEQEFRFIYRSDVMWPTMEIATTYYHIVIKQYRYSENAVVDHEQDYKLFKLITLQGDLTLFERDACFVALSV